MGMIARGCTDSGELIVTKAWEVCQVGPEVDWKMHQTAVGTLDLLAEGGRDRIVQQATGDR